MRRPRLFLAQSVQRRRNLSYTAPGQGAALASDPARPAAPYRQVIASAWSLISVPSVTPGPTPCSTASALPGPDARPWGLKDSVALPPLSVTGT